MQPLYYYYYYRNMKNPPLDDTPYINKMIEESIEEENDLINSYEFMLKDEKNENNIRIYKSLIKDAKTHINILQSIYGNINGKMYEDENQDKEVSKNIKDLIFRNFELSKKYRKILYGMKNNVHSYMLFDIIVDNINNGTLLNSMLKS